MNKNILESRGKKIIEKTLGLLGGPRLLVKIKQIGRKYLNRRQQRLTRSSASDIKRLGSLKPKYLHFGCGARIMSGWANIDITLPDDWEKMFAKYFSIENNRGSVGDFFRIDFTEAGIPLPNNTVEGIFHEDFIEHINQRDTFIFLAETLRVLKPGKVHRISTPDLAASMKKHSDFTKGKSGVYTNEWNKHGHLNVLTPRYLEEIARLVGYREVVFTTKDTSQLEHLPRGYRPGPDRLNTEQIFCDLVK